jgi:magnesium transporter
MDTLRMNNTEDAGTAVHESPEYMGNRKNGDASIEVFVYDAAGCKRMDHVPLDGDGKPGYDGVLWMNLEGVHDVKSVEAIGRMFNLHPLTIEDVVHTRQRPKLEDYEDYLFVVLKMLDYDARSMEVSSEQVGIVLGSDFVLCFQEGAKGDVFDSIRERLQLERTKVRSHGADFLCYSLIDAIVDRYFSILEDIGEKIEILEDQLVVDPGRATLQTIHHMKRELIMLRKSVWPLREVLGGLRREESDLISDMTTVYIRDVYDHTIQVIDTVETYRDMLAGMLDMYISSVSNRMNEVMKLLTIISTIFIPLTFLAGVYGMNFKYMPELDSPYGYPVLWGIMVVIGVLMMLFFKRKRWM